MRGPETRLRKKIVKALEEAYPEALFRKIHGGPMQNVGIPDLLCCVEGRFVGLEVKRPGKKATPAQNLEIWKIIKAGGIAGVVRTPEEALDLLKKGIEKWQHQVDRLKDR